MRWTGNVLLLASLIALAGAASAKVAQPVATPSAASLPKLDPVVRTLRNGMRIYALRDPSSANVSVHGHYLVGQRDDPRGRGGFAHLFEHLMFRTTRNLPDGVSAFVTSIGGQSNATTLFDYTSYYLQAPANRLEALIWLEGERLRNLVIDAPSFEAERGVVKEEIRQRAFAAPYGRILYTLLPAFAFGDHPYARPIGGTLDDLDRATLEDVRDFHEAYYRPDNAFFVIAGNFDPKQLDAYVDRYLGSLPRPSPPIVRDTRVAKAGLSARTIDSFAPNVPLPALIHSWRAAPATDPDAAGLALIDALLVRGASGRLRRALVDGSGVASNVTSYNLPARDGHAFALFVTLAQGRRIEEAEAGLEAEVGRLRDTLVPAAELNAVKNAMLGDALSRRETPRGRAFELGDAAAVAGDPLLADRMLQRILALTPEEVRAVARRRLDPAHRLAIRYRNEADRPSGQADVSGQDVSAMGPVVPPASRAPIVIAGLREREMPPGPGPEVSRVAPEVAERTLANGLRVIVARSTDVPLVTMRLVVDGGDAADPQGRAGLSDVLAAAVLRGAGSRDAATLAAAADSLGASLNAGSDADAAHLSITAPLANAEPAGQLLSDMALRPIFADAEIERVRTQQKALLTVAARQPMAAALRVLNLTLFAGSPYGRVPTAESLVAIGRTDVMDAHRRIWQPARSTLIITGAIEPDRGFALAERLLGAWQGDGRATVQAPRAPAGPAEPQIVVVDVPGAAQSAVVAGLRLPPRTTGGFDSVRVANARLGGGFLGFLNQEIRVRRGLSYGAGSQIEPRRDGSLLLAASQTRNDAAGEVAGLILAQMQRLGDQQPSETEAAERNAFVANALLSQAERTEGLAGYLGSLVSSRVPLEVARAELGGIEPVTAAALASAAASIRSDEAVVVVAGDSKTWIDALRQRFPTLRQLSVDGVPVP